MWLNSDGEPHSWLQKLRNMKHGGSLSLDHSLDTNINKELDCLGIEVTKAKVDQNPTAKTKHCYIQAPFICQIDASKFTAPSTRTKFPCIPQDVKRRLKRGFEDKYISNEERNGNGKYCENILHNSIILILYLFLCLFVYL